MLARWFVALLLAGACTAAWADEEDYTLDPVHTRVVFSVSHAGFSKAVGTISGSTGTVRFDPGDWRRARLDVTVPLQRLDLGDGKWNTAVLAGNLLDARRHPLARFVSTSVEPVDAQHARACGEMTLRGVTRPLCLEVTFNTLKRHPLPPFRRTAGFSATATVSRKAFGITAWPTVIGDEVELRIEAEAVRGRPRAPTDPAPAVAGDTAVEPSQAEDDPPSSEPAASPPVPAEPAPSAPQTTDPDPADAGSTEPESPADRAQPTCSDAPKPEPTSSESNPPDPASTEQVPTPCPPETTR